MFFGVFISERRLFFLLKWGLNSRDPFQLNHTMVNDYVCFVCLFVCFCLIVLGFLIAWLPKWEFCPTFIQLNFCSQILSKVESRGKHKCWKKREKATVRYMSFGHICSQYSCILPTDFCVCCNLNIISHSLAGECTGNLGKEKKIPKIINLCNSKLKYQILTNIKYFPALKIEFNQLGHWWQDQSFWSECER